jgi:large subunit ribosomal protein L23
MKTNIIISPLVTEKSSVAAQKKVYSFIVAIKSTKHSVAEAIESIFKVKVAEVNVFVRKGKEKRVGKKMMYKTRADKKIAIVKLKDGVIDLFPQT